LIGVLGTWLFIEIDGDRWWRATMILFGPRWTLLLPLIVLLPLVILLQRRWLWALAGIALLVAVPMMDLRITRAGLFPPDRSPGSLRVLTLNTHFVAVNAQQLKQLIDTTKPDIVALQEWYTANRKIIFPEPSWHTIQTPEALLASPYRIRLVGSPMGESDITAGVTYHYAVEFPSRFVSFYSVHLSSPHTAFSDVLHRSRYGVPRLTNNSIQRLREATNLNHAAGDDTIMAGDFNLPRDSTIFRSQLSSFTDAFTVAGLGYGLTYYSPWTAVRIDHILIGKNWKCDRCWVGPDIGSPHRPVIADIERAN
jgi:endonuclease/exonuclease/phosphatase (EEP) superfamily protein YafD